MFLKNICRSFTKSSIRRAEVELFVDGKSVKIEAGAALIQACEKAGATIPRFCYHERLAVAGNCRMCLVEVEKSPKPIASCAFPVAAGMKVFTDTPLVHKAREGVMEFLLSNHPLDCPICDQGGECDLQDQSIRYGSDRGRFREFEGKRAVEDKDFGPLVKTTMTRCIHCTRCVRYANELAGAEELGSSGRGNDMQIGMYIDKALNTELSGNVIDLCPVGALTSKPYEFKARPWELKKTESVDVLDALGSNIRIDSRGLEVLRILPRVNDDINEEWINDKTRFACDGLKRQRLTQPMIRKGSEFLKCSWRDALALVADRLKVSDPKHVAVVSGQLTDVETLVAAKDLFTRLGCQNLYLDGQYLQNGVNADFRTNYLLNSRIPAAEQADVMLLVGTNPRHEASLFNARIRKGYLNNQLQIALIGQKPNLNYDVEHLGTDLKALQNLKQTNFYQQLKQAKRPMIVVGSGAIESETGDEIYKIVSQLSQDLPNLIQSNWNGINILQRNASVAGALDVGFVPGPESVKVKDCSFVYLLGADDLQKQDLPVIDNSFVVYQGHHGDIGAYFADVILPGAAYTEKTATYVNAEGRPQLTRSAVTPPGEAREDWKILRALSEIIDSTLPYDDHDDLRDRMAEIAPHLIEYGVVEDSKFTKTGLDYYKLLKTTNGNSNYEFKLPIKDFYLTDPISRCSPTMAKCSDRFTKGIRENSTEKLSQQQ